jgi:hypothetical protein
MSGIKNLLIKDMNKREYNKCYYEENKVKLNQKRCEKGLCQICGKNVTASHINKHQLTNLCRIAQLTKV